MDSKTEFLRTDLEERIEDDGERVVQMADRGTWDAWGRKQNLDRV